MNEKDEMAIQRLIQHAISDHIEGWHSTWKEFNCPSCGHLTIGQMQINFNRYPPGRDPDDLICVVCGKRFERKNSWQEVKDESHNQ